MIFRVKGLILRSKFKIFWKTLFYMCTQTRLGVKYFAEIIYTQNKHSLRHICKGWIQQQERLSSKILVSIMDHQQIS